MGEEVDRWHCEGFGEPVAQSQFDNVILFLCSIQKILPG